jgi:hypothetical protein
MEKPVPISEGRKTPDKPYHLTSARDVKSESVLKSSSNYRASRSHRRETSLIEDQRTGYVLTYVRNRKVSTANYSLDVLIWKEDGNSRREPELYLLQRRK